MLVAQAKAAAERFLGRTIPDSRVEEITRQVEGQTQNLLLIGMPGCGKTTVGQFLADRLGRPGRMWTIRWKRRPAAPSGPFQEEGEEGFRSGSTGLCASCPSSPDRSSPAAAA